MDIQHIRERSSYNYSYEKHAGDPADSDRKINRYSSREICSIVRTKLFL